MEITPIVDITNRESLFGLLTKLQPVSKPIFGIMTPQHMVEHLTFSVGLSNGKLPQKLYLPEEKAEKIKAIIIYTPREIPVGFKTPLLPPNELLPLTYKDLNEAIKMLEAALKDFDNYFSLNTNDKPVHPTMGKLTHQEWIVFHNKHFTHHFKQFGLLS